MKPYKRLKMTNKSTEKEVVTPTPVKEVATPIAKPLPEFDQYINVILTKESYEVVKAAVAKNPEKLEKIMKYVNQFPQEQLKEVFSRSVF
jgi:5,10-methenyltetrahydromethanopterin hydrogenase